MRTPTLTLLLLAALLQWTAATMVSTEVVKYPVNMGPASDPHRIPVGSIPCEANHGYGLLELISTPFPSVPGGWEWDGGIELNGNLPSAFGISVELEFATNGSASPITLRVRKQAPPGYSPYTKEQVLLATIRCLMDAVRAGPRSPLKITVVTDDPADAPLQRLSGDYLASPSGKADYEETPLPGCVSMVDRNGIREIVFVEEGQEASPSSYPKPLWIPFPIEGDCDPGFALLPTWIGNRRPAGALSQLGIPWPVVQDCYNPSTGNPDGNLLTRQKLLSSFRTVRTEDQITLDADMNLTEDWNLADGMALLCWSAVLSEHPTDAKPLEVILRMHGKMDPRFQSWVADHGWKQVEARGAVAISTTFAWDPETGSLTKGFIPKYRVDRLANGGWEVTDREVYKRALEAAERDGVKLP